jgi:hypothetical protein
MPHQDTRPKCDVWYCGRPRRSLQWCATHYGRFMRTGDPATPSFRDPLHVRFWRKVSVGNSLQCWLWEGELSGKGYGRLMHEQKHVSAHRMAYELLVGPIPGGMQLDHLCKNPSCVNPSHLEPVTARENVLRSDGVAAKNARKTHCKRGHEFTPQNTIRPKANPQWRACRACQRIHDANSRRRRSAK